MQRNDTDLLGLQLPPAQHARWNRYSIRANAAIILSLAKGPVAQTNKIIDDNDRRPIDLWESFARLYTTSNEQAVINILQWLEELRFMEVSSWEVHRNLFH